MEKLQAEGLEKTLKEEGVEILNPADVVKIKPHIGEGGFGKVYRGKYKEFDVAIKKLKLELDTGDREVADVFKEILNEIKVVSIANSSDVPQFFGVWKNKDFYHLVFEFINGSNLRDIYTQLDYESKLSITRDICGILDQFHKKKLIHRDIKPANVMIKEGNKVKLIDFGVSKIAEHTATFTKVQTGTMAYMAPEMFNVDEDKFKSNDVNCRPVPVSVKSDIWSMGCLISEIFSGLKPWHSKKNQKLTDLHYQKKMIGKVDYPIPNELDDDVKKLIKLATDYDPNSRPSAGAMKDMIEEIMNKKDGTQTETQSETKDK